VQGVFVQTVQIDEPELQRDLSLSWFLNHETNRRLPKLLLQFPYRSTIHQISSNPTNFLFSKDFPC